MDRKIKTACVLTLGCKINSLESSAIKEQLESAGVAIVPFTQTADLYIINTCSVTSATDADSMQMIRRARKCSPDGIIAVTGCYAQLKSDALKDAQEIDYIFGNGVKGNIVERILQGLPKTKVVITDISKEMGFDNLLPKKNKGRSRSFLKIQDGCDSFCSYCIVPYARGRSRSLPFSDVINSIKRLVDAGFKETALSGIHIGKYGLDLVPKTDLTALVKEIESSTKLNRLRISSIEPNEVTDKFIEIAGSSKIVCNHLHIPLQSGDDEILKKMNRTYTTTYFSTLIKKLKESVKDIIIGADVIVGFPGETDRHFDNTYRFIAESAIDYLHVFPYSKREGTVAYNMPGQINETVKKDRGRILRTLGEQKRKAAYESFIGKKIRILFEKAPEKDGLLHGISTNYLNAAAKTFNTGMLNTEFELEVKEITLQNDKPLIFLG